MLLSEVVGDLAVAGVEDSPEECEITGVTDDSREVRPGFLFVARKGGRADGHDHIPEAIEKGAVAVILEREIAKVDAVTIRVPDSTKVLARVSSRFWGDPSRRLMLVGITGTNGKTTVSLLVQGILNEAGNPCGRIGTLGYEVGDETLPAYNTTPGAPQVQRLLDRMKRAGMTSCSMEVSSHALALGRVQECRFDTRVFTNLTRDHLDFHSTMEAYFAAKRLLFEPGYAKPDTISVINRDDRWGERLIRQCSGPVLTYGMSPGADVRALDSESTIHGLQFTAVTSRGEIRIQSSLSGNYNLYNLLAAVAAGIAMDLPNTAIACGISNVTAIPGRFEKIPGPGFTVVVDYAHTDDALKRLLKSARKFCRGKLITVFGCGGDRDPGKRPVMGRVAATLSDRVVITSDNPRTENPEKIIREIRAGIPRHAKAGIETIVDRRRAIVCGIRKAGKGDIVVVAGKGHEDYQITGEIRIHFDDREEVRRAIGERVRRKS